MDPIVLKLKKYIEEGKNRTEKSVAKELGTSQPTVHRIINDEQQPGAALVRSIEAFFERREVMNTVEDRERDFYQQQIEWLKVKVDALETEKAKLLDELNFVKGKQDRRAQDGRGAKAKNGTNGSV